MVMTKCAEKLIENQEEINGKFVTINFYTEVLFMTTTYDISSAACKFLELFCCTFSYGQRI